jgi:4a-hydroxytetrahydrobiopterin dehydratase
MELADKICGPCNRLTPRLTLDEIDRLMPQVPRWRLITDSKLRQRLTFVNFKEALEFVNKVGVVAEAENHHPDIQLGWGYVEVSFWTHAINGLSENDFILAAKVDALLEP